jgi:peptidoglycan/xylan/chitin deacetylase (PgdA/CDA1 family)
MLKHRTVVVLFIGLWIGLIGINSMYPVQWYWFFISILLFLSIEFYGAYFVDSGFHINTINSIKTDEKIVALTFDDGPMLQRTENVLNILNKHNAKAAFFCIGKKIKGNENLLKKIHEEGHLIGNHSYSHSNLFDLMNTKQMVIDLQLGNEEIKKVIEKTPLLFRPPFGVTTPSLAKACEKLNFDVIGWNVRSLDTTIKDKNKLVERVIRLIQPGSILLFHDTVEGVEIVLEEVLNYLKQNNYKVVELDKLIQKKAYA